MRGLCVSDEEEAKILMPDVIDWLALESVMETCLKVSA